MRRVLVQKSPSVRTSRFNVDLQSWQSLLIFVSTSEMHREAFACGHGVSRWTSREVALP